MVTLHIDGQVVAVEAGATVLAAARQAGIFIPTLCDHPALRPSGGCRLCVVEVQGARGPQTACTLPVAEGMVVTTDTPALRASRQFVLSMLFSESSHICPFCPVSGGDCELQNNAYQQGLTHWPYLPGWKTQPIDASAADFIFDPNRCILCRRCVRACAELVGNNTLGVAQRGAKTHLVADDEVPFGESSCVGCGTCVQICPTGALFGKREAYHGLAAQTRATASICLGCSVGCGLTAITRGGRLVRVDGDWSSPVSGGVLCQMGRYAPLKETRERVLTPLVRRAGALTPASWEAALSAAAAGLPGAAGLISPRLPAEALLAFRQVMALGLHSRQVATTGEPFLAGLVAGAAPLTALDEADVVVLLGAEVEHNHEVAGFFIKRNLPRGLQLAVISAAETTLVAHVVLHLAAGDEAAVVGAWLGELPPPAGVEPSAVRALAELVTAAAHPLVLYGTELAARQPEVVKRLWALAARRPNLRLLAVGGAANSLAAERLGLTSASEPVAGQPVFIDLGDEAPSLSLLASVAGTPFKVVAASYHSPLTEQADVVLPVETAFELSGHYLNLEGRWQLACGALTAPGDVRSQAALLAGLAERLGVPLTVEWNAEYMASPALLA